MDPSVLHVLNLCFTTFPHLWPDNQERDSILNHFNEVLYGKPIGEQYQNIQAYVRCCQQVNAVIELADLAGERILANADRAFNSILQNASKKDHK